MFVIVRMTQSLLHVLFFTCLRESDLGSLDRQELVQEDFKNFL